MGFVKLTSTAWKELSLGGKYIGNCSSYWKLFLVHSKALRHGLSETQEAKKAAITFFHGTQIFMDLETMKIYVNFTTFAQKPNFANSGSQGNAFCFWEPVLVKTFWRTMKFLAHENKRFYTVSEIYLWQDLLQILHHSTPSPAEM